MTAAERQKRYMAKLMAKAKAHDKLRAENAELLLRLAALKRLKHKERNDQRKQRQHRR